MDKIFVAYANEDQQVELSLSFIEGETVAAAISRSGVLEQFPEIDMKVNKVGIYSRICSADQVLEERDRIEIYRPLKIDPKQARRDRAKRG